MISGENYDFSTAEQDFIANLEYADNVGNLRSKNSKILASTELAGLKAFIESQIELYKLKLLRIRDKNEIYITQSWTNISRPGQFHPKHRHPNSLISGVMFFSDNAAGNHPALRFHRTVDIFPLELLFDELNEFNSTCREFDPVRGRLVLFPSLVEHDVGINTSDTERITFSFNTFVHGVIGGSEQLTEVELPQT